MPSTPKNLAGRLLLLQPWSMPLSQAKKIIMSAIPSVLCHIAPLPANELGTPIGFAKGRGSRERVTERDYFFGLGFMRCHAESGKRRPTMLKVLAPASISPPSM